MTAESQLPASIQRQASSDQRRFLDACSRVAARLQIPVYLVGGAIRDLLLTGTFLDLDVVAEGDAIELAKHLAEELGGEARTHSRFLTAEVVRGNSHIDLVTARREKYAEPASLPTVTSADLAEDLARRDFTINTLAVRLWPQGEGEIIDLFDGQQDLEQRVLRVLHERSFFDDPTRILRGVRLGARLDLSFDPRTADLARAALQAGVFQVLSPSRLRRELILLLEDKDLEGSLRHLDRLGLLAFLGRTTPLLDKDWLRITSIIELQGQSPSRVDGEGGPRWWLVSLMSLFLDEDDAGRVMLADRLRLDEELTKRFLRYSDILSEASGILDDPHAATHVACHILDKLSGEELALLMALATDRVADRIDSWVNQLRNLRLTIAGTDLKAAGFTEGPAMGRALQSTLEARQDGTIDAYGELEFAIQQLRVEEG